MPTLRSRAVSEDGTYQIDFGPFGISLTKITQEDTLLLPFSHWAYLLTNQYIEGTDYLNYNKRMDVGGLQPPTGLVAWPRLNGGIVMNNGNDQLFTDYDALPSTQSVHECKFVRYVGLSESFNHCESCGKKQ